VELVVDREPRLAAEPDGVQQVSQLLVGVVLGLGVFQQDGVSLRGASRDVGLAGLEVDVERAVTALDCHGAGHPDHDGPGAGPVHRWQDCVEQPLEPRVLAQRRRCGDADGRELQPPVLAVELHEHGTEDQGDLLQFRHEVGSGQVDGGHGGLLS
jgi:hypothetical protein